MSQKKLLVVGAGIDQLDPIKIAQNMGHKVFTVDMNADAPGMKYADDCRVVSTVDFEGVLEYAKASSIDGIMTVASETSIPTIAKVCKAMNLPGISEETALAATNKNVMRKKVLSAGVRCPESKEVSSLAESIHFIKNVNGPWVIKPSDTSGQRGITFFNEPTKIENYFREAIKYSRDQKAIIEEFIEGPEINVCSMVNKGKVDFLSLSDRITDPNKNFGIAVKHLVPGDLSENEIDAIKEASIKSTQAIGLKDGIAYPQLINANDGPAFIEIAARMPGGHNREIAMYTSGVDMVKVAIRQALGEDVKLENSITESVYPSTYVRFITRNDIPTSKKILKGFKGLEKIASHPQVKKVFMHLKPGDSIPNLVNSTARFGGLITVGNSRQESVKIAEDLVKKIEIY